MSNYFSFQNANALFRNSEFNEALKIYYELEKGYLPDQLRKSLRINIKYCAARAVASVGKIGSFRVESIDEVLVDINSSLQPSELKTGITALIRAKNASRFLRLAVESVAPIVNEVILVDNLSSDDSVQIARELERKFKNVNFYRYDINIPLVGKQHEEAVASGSQNTLGTYYNWCLSKVTHTNVLKWDADFVCIQNNLKKLISLYSLDSEDFEKVIWCTGMTAYNGINININSYYDEFRIFSKKHGGCWENWKGCETLTPTISRSPRKYIYPSLKNVKSEGSDQISLMKQASPPIFVEIKDHHNLKSETMLLDRRDKIDNALIEKYRHDRLDYIAPNILNSFRILIVLPNLNLGGGNYWAKLIIDQFSYIGIQACIGSLTVSGGGSSNSFYGVNKESIVRLNQDNIVEVLNKFDVTISTSRLEFSHKELRTKLFFFTHSDTSYINKHIINKPFKIIGLNKATQEKFRANGREIDILRNYLPKVMVSKNVRRSSKKVLFCNRISEDKNIPMLLSAWKLVMQKIPDAVLTILAGGADDKSSDFNHAKALINYYGLSHCVELLPSVKNVEPYYIATDLVVLPSLSEGCSYGLLEAINYELPVIATDIYANNEVTRGYMPTFTFSGLKDVGKDIFSVPDGDLYGSLLSAVGYLNLNIFYETSTNGRVNYELVTGYFDALGLDFKLHKNSIKTLVPTLVSNKLLSEELPALQLHGELCSKYLENTSKLSEEILSAFTNIENLKNKAIELKTLISPEYFDQARHLSILCNIVFGDKINFFGHFDRSDDGL